MLFSSLEFLYLFLPLSLLLYYASPMRWRNAVLLAVSLVFYGTGEPVYVALMILTVLADYGFGLAVERRVRRTGKGRGVLILAVAFNLSLLGFFKYYDFLAEAVGLPVLGVPLPIGISFYTFQALSYVIDVYRKEVAAQRSVVAFGTYVSLFPQLIAGPIVRYSEIDGQLTQRVHSSGRVAAGIATFCVGLSKKVLLANPAGEIMESLGTYGTADTTLGAWLWLILYAAQIYFDFSGYSDMAVGLGRMLGFDFPENFRYPYTAKSITEFWRRWHITLSSWFREYVYIPLGGNRRGRLRTYRNLLITWLLTGIWHGAAWNFLGWGLYFFVILALEKAFLGKLLERLPRPIRHGYALALILFGWHLFAGAAAPAPGVLFGMGGARLWSGTALYELLRHVPFLILLGVGCTELPRRLYRHLETRWQGGAAFARNGLCLAALILCTAYLVDSGYNPFLYFRF